MLLRSYIVMRQPYSWIMNFMLKNILREAAVSILTIEAAVYTVKAEHTLNVSTSQHAIYRRFFYH